MDAGVGVLITVMEYTTLVILAGQPLSVTETLNWYGVLRPWSQEGVQQKLPVTEPSPMLSVQVAGGLVIAGLKMSPVCVRNKLSPLVSLKVEEKQKLKNNINKVN